MSIKNLLLVFTILLGTGTLTAQDFPMDGNPISTCTGFFQDSGGPNAPYQPNENITTTICPGASGGTHVQLYFPNMVLGAGDVMCFFDGEDVSAPSLGCSNDGFDPNAPIIIQATAVNISGCVTISFVSDATGETDGINATIDCVAACQTVNSVLVNANPSPMPIDTGWIDICPGDIVTFEGAGFYPQNGAIYPQSDGTSTFEWDFGDGIFSVGTSASHVYNEPGGYIVQLEVIDVEGCKNTNFISQRIRVSVPPTFELEGLTEEICVGDTISLNAAIDTMMQNLTVTAMPNEGSFQVQGIRSDSLFLPDGNGTSYETSINFGNFAPGQTLMNVSDLESVCVNMEHSYIGDLGISLECPDGTSIELHPYGSLGGTYLGEPIDVDTNLDPGLGYDYCWTTDATNGTWIQYLQANPSSTLPAGDYNPQNPFDAFVGCPLNGDWTITVTDNLLIDNGYIFNWSINFNESLFPNVETFTPQFVDWGWVPSPTAFYQTQDSIAASPVNAGAANYTFEILDDFGCTWDTNVVVQVLPFQHPDCYSCQDNLNPVADTTVCAGEPVLLEVGTAEMVFDTITFEAFPDYDIGFANHPPTNPYLSTINVNSVQPATITNPFEDIASVCINFETDFLADMSFFLVAPDGTQMMLSTNNGGASDFLTNTCFSPTAATPITGGTSPYTGYFLPEGNFAVLGGVPFNGTWALRVTDAFGNSGIGTLNSWSISFRNTNELDFSWSPSAELDCMDCPNPISIPTTNHEYIVTVEDSYNCIQIDTINVLAIATVAAPVVTCQETDEGELTFSWPMVDTYTTYEININNGGWMPTTNSLSHVLTGLTNGDAFDVEVRVFFMNAPCDVEIGTTSCTYVDPCLLSITETHQSAGCFGECDGAAQISTFNATSPAIYTITELSTGTTFSQNNGNFTGLCAGLHFVEVVDAVLCSDTVTIEILQPDPILVTLTEDQSIDCFGNNNACVSAAVMGGAGDYSYSWDDPLGQNLQSVCNIGPGMLEVEVEDINNCSTTQSIMITEPTELTAMGAGEDVNCFGGNDGTAEIMPTGGTYPYSYAWQGSAVTDSLITDINAGSIDVTIMDANGCTIVETIVIGEPVDGVTASAGQTLVSCFDQDVSEALAAAMGGTGPNYTYEWSVGAQNTALATNLPPGTHTVTVTDENDCETTTTVLVEEWDEVAVNLISVDPLCNTSANGLVSVNFIEGGDTQDLAQATFQWSEPGATDVTLEDLLGDNTYSVTVTTPQGCEGTASEMLTAPPALVIATDVIDVSCAEYTDGVALVTGVANSTGNIQYQWDAAAANQVTASASDLIAGTYGVTVIDDNDCEAMTEVEITEPEAITVEFDIIDNDCFGDEEGAVSAMIAGGSGGLQYQWSNNLVNTDKIVDLESGVYYLTITDDNGCVKIDSAAVLSPAGIEASFMLDSITCFGDRDGMVTVETEGGVGPFSYSLNGEDYTGSNVFIGLTAGDYDVFIRDNNGCIYNDFVSLDEPPQFFLETVDDTIGLGQTTVITPTPQDFAGEDWQIQWNWLAPYEGTLNNTVIGNPTTNTFNTITYTVVALDANGCETEAQVTIFVQKNRTLDVPTGFTPGNNDNNNDLLVVHGKEGTIVNSFQVFDRWGELVYQASEFPVNLRTSGWDGTFNGENVMAGVYIWHAEVTYIDGVTESYKGSTTLIR